MKEKNPIALQRISFLPNEVIPVNIVLVGTKDANKSKIIARFDETTSSVVGIDFKVKTMIINNRAIKLVLWDTAGQERLRSMTTTVYYKKAKGILLAVNLENANSFAEIQTYYDSAKSNVSEDCKFMMIATYEDMQKIVISDEKIKQRAESLGIDFIITSINNQDKISSAFNQFTSQILGNDSKASRDNRISVYGTDTKEQETDKKKCLVM